MDENRELGIDIEEWEPLIICMENLMKKYGSEVLEEIEENNKK